MKQRLPSRQLTRFAIALAVVAVVVLIGSVAEACPTCKSGLEDESTGGNLIQGYFWSIMFMMATPFAILGCFSGYMYHEVRKARRQRATEETHSDAPQRT